LPDKSLKEKLKNKFANLFELPKDVVLDLPHISMVGNIEFHLENHKGIIEYEENLIRIRIHKGQVLISGKELMIEELTKVEVKIKGHIQDVIFKYH